MREISIDELDDHRLPIFTFLQYGDTRSGKTEFAATFPRPYIYADAVESGYKTVLTMDRDKWFERNVPPIIKAVDNMADIARDEPSLDLLISSGRVKTIVFDAFSFYADFFLGQLQKLQAADKQDNRKAYGDLGKHLREVRVNLGRKGVNVVYNCLAQHPETDPPTNGRPMIPGQQSDKFAAGVDFLWFTRTEDVRKDGKVAGTIYERRTRPYNRYVAGHRLGAKAELLPDPFIGTYTDFLTILGYDVDKLRASLPKIANPAARPTPPAPAAKPPVTITTAPTARPVAAATPRVTVPAPKATTPPAINNPASRGATVTKG